MERFLDIYNRFINHLPDIGLGLSVLIVTFLFAFIISRIIKKRIKKKNPLPAKFIGSIIAISINILGIVLFLEIVGLGDIAGHFLAGAGILTFVLGFAFKDIGENFLSGILLAFKSPFKIDDLIESLSIIGYVKEITLRETVIKTTDGKDVFVPNSQILKNPLINYTIDGLLRYDFLIGLDYDSDFLKAINIIQDILANSDNIHKDKRSKVVIEEAAASTVNLRIYFWIDTFKLKSKSHHLNIRSNLINKIIKELINSGFYLPAEIIEIKNYNDSALNLKDELSV